MAHSNWIADAFERSHVQFDSEKELQKQLWEALKKETWPNSGSRCNMNRFMGTLHTSFHRRKR